MFIEVLSCGQSASLLFGRDLRRSADGRNNVHRRNSLHRYGQSGCRCEVNSGTQNSCGLQRHAITGLFGGLLIGVECFLVVESVNDSAAGIWIILGETFRPNSGSSETLQYGVLWPPRRTNG